MNQHDLKIQKILMIRSKIKKPFRLSVAGNSMLPILHAGDSILVRRKDIYEEGEILVFFYKQNELLFHRLLKIKNGRYFCKGDNAFRLEDISAEQILGAVLLENDPHKTSEFINDSYNISLIFKSFRYDTVLTKQKVEYQVFHEKYLL